MSLHSNHSQTVECKLNLTSNLGTVKCRICDASYQTEITHLTDPIDVYSEWVDKTEEANAPQAGDDAGDENGGAVDDEEEAAMLEREKKRKAGRKKARRDSVDADEEEEEIE